MNDPRRVYVCAMCREEFPSEDEWDDHLEESRKNQELYRKAEEEALSLVGKTFTLDYIPRYPTEQETSLGAITVTVEKVIMPEGVCSGTWFLTHPVLFELDKPVPLASDRGYYASRNIGYRAFREAEGSRVKYMPCGKDNCCYEHQIIHYLENGEFAW